MRQSAPAARKDPALPFVQKANRAAAYKAARRHTLLVRTLRLVLPLAAVATVGFYGLNTKFGANVGNATASVEDVQISTQNLRMVSPRLEGVTDGNGRYVVSAASGTQQFDAPDIILLEKIDARLTQANGDWAHLVSDEGRFESKADKMDLNGNIRVTSRNGMDARLSVARIDMKAQRVVSTEPVRVDLQNGHIDSESMLIDTGSKTLSFVGDVRVRLFKRPQNTQETTQENVPLQ